MSQIQAKYNIMPPLLFTAILTGLLVTFVILPFSNKLGFPCFCPQPVPVVPEVVDPVDPAQAIGGEYIPGGIQEQTLLGVFSEPVFVGIVLVVLLVVGWLYQQSQTEVSKLQQRFARKF